MIKYLLALFFCIISKFFNSSDKLWKFTGKVWYGCIRLPENVRFLISGDDWIIQVHLLRSWTQNAQLQQNHILMENYEFQVKISRKTNNNLSFLSCSMVLQVTTTHRYFIKGLRSPGSSKTKSRAGLEKPRNQCTRSIKILVINLIIKRWLQKWVINLILDKIYLGVTFMSDKILNF